jgi:hypothetical protein
VIHIGARREGRLSWHTTRGKQAGGKANHHHEHRYRDEGPWVCRRHVGNLAGEKASKGVAEKKTSQNARRDQSKLYTEAAAKLWGPRDGTSTVATQAAQGLYPVRNKHLSDNRSIPRTYPFAFFACFLTFSHRFFATSQIAASGVIDPKPSASQ